MTEVKDGDYAWNLVWEDGEPTSVTVFDGGTHTISNEHPDFQRVLIALRFKEPIQNILDLMEIGTQIQTKFERLSDRVTVRGGKLYLDSNEMHSALTETIVRFHKEHNTDFEPLVNFLEKLETNPLQHSREQLYRWMKNQSFLIHPDGDIIGYKGVQCEYGADAADPTGDAVLDLDTAKSTSSGHAIVDGEDMNGIIPNKVGSIVEMPRDEVTFDPAAACSSGLHVGTASYARGFGNVVLTVKVNPRDVVSVPNDANDQKMRVCRYRVVGLAPDVEADELLSTLNLPWEQAQEQASPTPDNVIDPGCWDDDDGNWDEDWDDPDPFLDDDDDPFLRENADERWEVIVTAPAFLAKALDDLPDEPAQALVEAAERMKATVLQAGDWVEYRLKDFLEASMADLRKARKALGVSADGPRQHDDLAQELAKESRRRRKNRR